jgi:hypothetical protein
MEDRQSHANQVLPAPTEHHSQKNSAARKSEMQQRTKASLHLDPLQRTASGKMAMKQGTGSFGAPGAIRTPGPQIRSLMLYPAELRVHGRAAFSLPSRAMQGRKTHIGLTRRRHTPPMVFGSRIRNSVPSSSLRSNSSLPPWPRTSSAEIANPRPDPPLRAPP